LPDDEVEQHEVTWTLHLPDHNEVKLGADTIVGRDSSIEAIRKIMAVFTDVSRHHLRLTIANGVLYAQNISERSVTYLVTKDRGEIVERGVASVMEPIETPATFRLGDHAYLVVKKGG